MTSVLIGMFAETFIHPGIGQANSAIDLPVARERTTGYPFIPGSGVKGGWKSWAKEQAGYNDDADALFGKGDNVNANAGTILFSDARLVLLPVRSLNTAYIWLTCPLLLERLTRDIARTGGTAGFAPENIWVEDGKYLSCTDFKELVLEEREFTREVSFPEQTGVHIALKKLLPDNCAARLERQLAVVSDTEFAWFAKYALPISAHNQLDENKTSKNLWYEEMLPPDTVMYTMLAERADKAGSLGKIVRALEENAFYCQFGGNQTLGQGWFHLKLACKGGGAHAE